MAEIHESQRFGSTTADEVASFERSFGRALPADYRSFLERHNGGVPVPDHWHCGPVHEEPGFGWTPPSVQVDRLFGLVTEPTWASLAWAVRCYRGRIPEGLVPIADDPAGNVFCLDLTDADPGTVWYWDHENEAEEGEPAWRENLLPLAPSFSAFLDGLIDEAAEERRSDEDLQQILRDGRR